MAIWEKQADETPKSYNAFCAYRDLGIHRTLQKAAQIHYGREDANKRQLETWSAKYDWVKRAAAYDEKERQQYEAALAKDYEQERLRERERRQTTVKKLQDMLAKLMREQMNVEMSPSEFNALSNAAKTVLNESRAEYNDMPTQRQELSGPDGNAIEVKGYTLWSPDSWEDSTA
jgi:hypothetical protein